MTMANAYWIYCMMVTEQMPDCKCFSMKDVIKELMFSLMQRGVPMRKREASHPQPYIGLSIIHGWKSGKKIMLDLTRQAVAEEGHHQKSWTEYCVLRRIQKKQTQQQHQSMGATARVMCCWGKSPSLKNSKEKVTQSYRTISRCKESSAKMGSNVWLCSGAKRSKVLPCRIDYHKANFNKVFPSTAGG